MSGKPIVAIVGRPNVGKSRLFNRILHRTRSIVLDMPGVTRDRIYADAALSGEDYDLDVVLVDTGGFDPSSEDPIMRRVLEQTQLAIDEADAVVYLTDGRVGVMPEDHEIARRLRRAGKKVVIGVNKCDGPAQDDLVADFYQLGIPDVIPVSGAHGRNVGELEELVVKLLPAPEAETGADIEEPPEAGTDPSETVVPIRVAVIGRPNVGKSSLINRLLGEDRHLVSDVAGTTVDTIDSLVEFSGQSYLFIDTAGIRRKRSIALQVERFSVLAALRGLERSDVALLLIDPTQDVANQDAKVSAFAYEKGKAVILVVSKWDQLQGEVERKEFTERLQRELPHLNYAPIVYTSAHTGFGLERLLPMIRQVHEEYCRRITTGKLNQFVENLMMHTPPPSRKGKIGKLYYLTQIDIRPPRFLVSVNDPEHFHFSYRRFFVNALRKEYGFAGVPLLVGYRAHSQKVTSEKREERGKEKAKLDPNKQATAAKRLNKAAKKKNASPKVKRAIAAKHAPKLGPNAKNPPKSVPKKPTEPRKTSIKRKPN